MLIIGWASLPITVIIDYRPTEIVGGVRCVSMHNGKHLIFLLGENMIVKGNLVDCTKKCTIRIRENSFLVVEDGIISKIYSEDEFPDSLKNEEIVDYGDSLILPGLIDILII